MIPRKLFRQHKARRFALLAGLSIGLIVLQSTSAAPLSLPKNHRMSLDEQLERRSGHQELANASTASSSSPDFVIGSLEDEKKFGLKIVDKRHHYEQQSVELADNNQVDQAMASPGGQQEESTGLEKQQIQARNEREAVQLSEQQQQLAEQVIMDHRPQGADTMSADQFASSTQTPPTSTTVSSVNTSPSAASSTTLGPFSQATGGSPSSTVTQLHWMPAAGSQQVVYARQAQPASSSNTNQQQQQQQFGNMMSASNQVMSSVQYPTSINSIISEQQQPQSVSQQQTGSFQTQMVNGQQQLVLVPQNGAASNMNSQVIGLAPNGRRLSISSWLRGLGSMLSNIFYRRDHGALSNAQLQAGGVVMQASGSAPGGSWIQLGPNAPHWLTQAQSAIQQFQQQHQQLGLPGSSRLSSFLASGPQQQAANTVTIALPQQQLNSANTFQQPQIGDLQTSGSSNSYVTVQAPASVATIAASQPYQQQQQQQSNMAAQMPTLLHVGQLQPVTSSGASGLQIQQQGSNIQVASAAPQPAASLVTKSNFDQIKQVTPAVSNGQSQSSLAPSTSGTTQTRFGRSSRQQAQTQQQQTTTPISQTTNGNLPLAHYSHYSASD